jgi:predicted 3-demethylubiquinone-9 3-methyltransferase (glyoxalase superfamily)
VNVNTIVDLLALVTQAGAAISTYTEILGDAHQEGRTKLTDAEKERVRAMVLASEARLEAATRE